MGTDSKYYKEVIGKLEKICRRKYLSHILSGMQIVLFVTMIFFTFLSLFELIAHLSSSTRTILFLLILAVTAGAVIYSFIIPLLRYFKFFRRETYFQVASEVGDHFGEIKDDLLNSMQLVYSEKDRKLYSKEMINEAFRNVYNRIKDVKFESIISFKKTKNTLLYLIGAVIVVMLMFLFVPGMQAAFYRLINYDTEFIEPQIFNFIISPGNSEITKGEDILISASVDGKAPEEIYFALKNEVETEFRYERVTPDSTGNYNMNFTSVRTTFKYFATAEKIRSDEFEIKVIDRPIVKTLELEIIPPLYSKMEKLIQKDNGNVTSLVGTRVNINLSSTKNLGKAFLQFRDSTSLEFKVAGNEATGKFIVKEDNQYILKLFDEGGNENSSPITYQVQALFDAYPTIEMVAPNVNIPLANDNRVNLVTKINDDFGFSRLMLNYRLSASRYEPPQTNFTKLEIELPPDEKEISVNYIWNLSLLSLGVEDVISYYLEVFDNDNISGPKSAKTSIFMVRVPSLDEILAEADQTQTEAEKELEQTLKEAEDLQKTLQDIDQELKKDEEKLTWEEKEKIEEALDKFEELQQKVNDLSDELQEMQNNLQQNNLLSEETLEKYMELQDLMDELTSEEMKKALERLQNTLEQLNRKMTQQQLEKFKFDEERFKKSIERTLNLLKRIQIEQKIDELVKRTEELMTEQNELKEQTEQHDPSNKNEQNELSQKQKDISEKIEKLENEMKNLDEKMNDMDDMPQEELEKMMEDFKKQQNDELSDQASQNIQQNNKQEAMQQQQQVSNNMDKLNQQMQEMKNAMMMQTLMQTFTDMMKMLDNMLELSKMQEELKNDTRDSEPNSSSFNDNAEMQENLKRNLSNIMSQMAELSQKTFAITPEMGKALGDAYKQMQQSIQSLQNRNGSLATINQGQAMKHLNEAASLMKGSMEAMLQGGGGKGGMMSLMQQLQQLSSQQMNLNSLTQMLQQMQQGQLSPQQQGELQRLAQQQDLIRKSLRQLNEEAKVSGESKKIPADLDNILNEMREVLTDLNTKKLNDELIQKQEHILSKLLDAQRSINERDFEKERKSVTGENIVRKSPSENNLSSDERKEKLIDELNKAVQEGYARDYEELILKYYEAVQNENIIK
jgi:hypothetical protein